MALTHVTFYFVQGRQQWVEQFYRSDFPYSATVSAALALAQARFSILGAGATLTRFRVSQMGAPHNSISRHVSGPQPSAPATLASTAALMQLQAGTGLPHYRPYWLHGLPSGAWVQIGGVVTLAPQWSGPINAYMALLVKNGWLVQATEQLGPAYPLTQLVQAQYPPEPAPIVAQAQWHALPPSTLLLATIASPPIVLPAPASPFVRQTVRISRAKWFPPPKSGQAQVNGEWPLYGVLDSVIAAQLPAVPPGGWQLGGTVALSQRSYLPITGWTFTRVGTHKVGPARKSNQPSGSTPKPLEGLPVFVTVPDKPLLPPPGVAAQVVAPFAPPPGTVPVPPPPVVPPPSPPPGPGPFVEESMDPRPVTLTTLADVGVWLRQYCGFYGYPDEHYPIGIGKMTNAIDTWVVMLFGQRTEVLGSPGMLTSIAAGIQAPTAYEAAAAKAMEAIIPEGHSVLMYGYSLGGMVAELLWSEYAGTWQIVSIVTLGSPITCLSYFDQPITRFTASKDIVPIMTPFSTFAFFTGAANLIYTVIPTDPAHPGVIDGHVWFLNNPGLDQYNAWGQPIGGVGGPLELDALRMFPVT
jgi:hypothetical protein